MGANYGDFSYDLLNNFKEVFLIEPNPYLLQKLEDKFKNRKKVKIYNFGINNKNSTKKFYISADTGATLSSIKKQNKISKQNHEMHSFYQTNKTRYRSENMKCIAMMISLMISELLIFRCVL